EKLQPLYLSRDYRMLSDLNRTLIEFVCTYLGIKSKITNSSDYALAEGKSERLADLVKQAAGDIYVSGPAAKDYLDESVFGQLGIRVNWFDYDGYPEYPQLWGEFEHGVSVLDLLFNCGPDAANYMKFVAQQNS